MQKIRKIFKSKRSDGGFTLVEAMVTMLIFTFLMSALYSMTMMGQESWKTNSVYIDLHQQLRRAMDSMIFELRQAGDSSITTVPADGAWRTSISFKTPTGVTSGSLNWNANAIVFMKGGTNNKQLLRVQAGVTKVIGLDIQSLQFRRQTLTPDILEIALIGQKNTLSGRSVTYQLNFNVQLRN